MWALCSSTWVKHSVYSTWLPPSPYIAHLDAAAALEAAGNSLVQTLLICSIDRHLQLHVSGKCLWIIGLLMLDSKVSQHFLRVIMYWVWGNTGTLYPKQNHTEIVLTIALLPRAGGRRANRSKCGVVFCWQANEDSYPPLVSAVLKAKHTAAFHPQAHN